MTKGQKLHERCGTPAYIAPEILREVGYDGTLADVWSSGVVLYAMLYGNFPFRATNVEELEQLILGGNYTLPPEISESARDLIAKILNLDPAQRITIPEIYAHPWMRDVDYRCIHIYIHNLLRIVSLFTEEEINAIKKEYDYKERQKDNSVSAEESSVFTVHGLNTTAENNDSESDLSKSAILAPFNSNEPDERSFVDSVQPLVISKHTIKFCSKLREIDRQYERDNNSKIDNGVYVQAALLASPPISPKSSGTKGLHAGLTRSTAGSSTTQSSTPTNQLDKNVLEQMERMGFDRSFVIASLNGNVHNSATTCYYLMAEE